MISIKTTARILTILVLMPGISAGGLPAKQEVLKRFAALAGGPEAQVTNAPHGYFGFSVDHLSWDEKGPSLEAFLALATADGRLRMIQGDRVVNRPGGPGFQGGDRLLSWWLNPAFAREVETYFPGLRVRERVRWQGRWKVLLVPQGLPVDTCGLYFDEESGLLTHVGLHAELMDWQEKDGILRPRTLRINRKGGHTDFQIVEEFSGSLPHDP